MFVSASFMEGLPVVLMEALGLGIPVVAPGVVEYPSSSSTGKQAGCSRLQTGRR